MLLRLPGYPLNSGTVWFSRENVRRCEIGWRHPNADLWWAIFGFSGSISFKWRHVRRKWARTAFMLALTAAAVFGSRYMLRPVPTADQLFGCKLADTMPNGECP